MKIQYRENGETLGTVENLPDGSLSINPPYGAVHDRIRRAVETYTQRVLESGELNPKKADGKTVLSGMTESMGSQVVVLSK